MIGLNEDLKQRHEQGRPVRIGLVGTGQMGIDVMAQTTRMKGVEIVVTADLDASRAKQAYTDALDHSPTEKADTPARADALVAQGKKVYTDDFRVVTDMRNIDVMLEATGVPEVGAVAAICAARAGHHLAMMNVETDITVGPLLRWYAEQKGVLYALAAGDEPAACKELYDFAESLGFTIVAAGKGKNNPLDRHAKPTDAKWAAEAVRRGLNPNMLVEFVDGSKTMIEMAAVSNATGLVPDVRGMHGPQTTRDKLNKVFALRKDGGILNRVGVVDYGIGGIHPGVFLVVATDHPRLRQALVYRDMGDGPCYTLFRPFHLCSIEVPLTCAMLVLRNRSNMVPLDKLTSEVFAVAKQDLKAGDILDAIGGSTFYSLIDRFEIAQQERLLPIGLAKGAQLTRAVAQDKPITYDDVRINESSIIFRLRALQDRWMNAQIDAEQLLAEIDSI
ncbi:MAG: NAD(P)-dependent oxidoreductase [Phycisphaerae bacterium]|nr:NAD(P)-dependent oxidoreductase [Phycisphaerae bacterium]